MAFKFKVPRALEDLETPPSDDSEDILYAQDVTEIDGLDPGEIHRLVAALVTEMADKEVFGILEQPIFDQLYTLIRGYTVLDNSAKTMLIDCLCTNFVQLNVSTSILITSLEDSSEDMEDILHQTRAHNCAIKVYAYFLFSIVQTEEDMQSGLPAEEKEKTAGSRGGTKGRGRKKHVPQDWDWAFLRTRSLRALAGALQNDLQLICESRQVDENLISFLAKVAFNMLKNKDLLEKGDYFKDSKEQLCIIISACAVKFGYGISSVVTIIDLLHKFEHLPIHMADIVWLAENQHSGYSLAVDLLRAIGKINPKNFERDNSGAENLGTFIEELAIRLPKLMMTNLSVIMCHMDGKAYKMRNSLVKIIGTLLVEAKKNPEGMGASVATRLHNEEALLSILLERSRDIAAHTRKHVLQTWATLCKQHAVPIGHWNLVSDLAAGRLEDNTAIVRKNALQLLSTLLEYNPFGPSLRTAPFEATLDMYKAKLAQLSPSDRTPSAETAEKNGQESDAIAQDVQANESTTESPDGVPTTPQPEQEDIPQVEEPNPQPVVCTDIAGLEHTRALVASLETALRFSKCIGSTMDILALLLASSSIGDVESTIQLLILYKQFDVDGSVACLRKALPLVFSQEQGVKTAVEEAFKTLYLKGKDVSPSEVALNLTNMAVEASLGDLASIEALVSTAISKRDIEPATVSALWDKFTFLAEGSTPAQSRGALSILCMAAKSNPHILSSHLQNITDIGFGRWAKEDVLLARYACIALQRLPEKDRASLKSSHKIFNILSSLIVGPGLLEASWYSAAEQAINAIYVLHPAPENFSAGLLVKLAQTVFSKKEDALPGSKDFSSVSLPAISRFLFAVGHIALKQLVYIETSMKKVRKQRAETGKAAANNAAETSDAECAAPKEDIDLELGTAAAEDAKLDELADRAEKEILNGDQNQPVLISKIAPTVATLCMNSSLMRKNKHLRSSAMLALCKLMAIDASFCEKHLQLLFTVAKKSKEDSVRSNCVIALGDLALRFPNLLEPWMESMYSRVHDQSIPVRKNSVLVLSHLILNDLIKVKGYISEMAMHLVDEDQRISDLVKLFFNELSKKGNNPIHNLLPDILSRLSSNPDLSQEQFNLVIQFLTGTVKKSKQMDGLIEKFCSRFLATTDVRQWQDLAYCLCQLTYTQSSMKRLGDNFKLYEQALGDAGVIGNFKALIAKARKLATAELKLAIDEFEEKLMACHKEKKEQEEAWQKAQEYQRRTQALQAQFAEANIGEDSASVDNPSGELASAEALQSQEAAIGEESVTDARKISIVKEERLEVESIAISTIVDDTSSHTEMEDATSRSVQSDSSSSRNVSNETVISAEGQVSVEPVSLPRPSHTRRRRNRVIDDDPVIVIEKVVKTEIITETSVSQISASRDLSDSTVFESCEEEFSGTQPSQPYPYMDLDLESAKEPNCATSTPRVVRVKHEVVEESGTKNRAGGDGEPRRARTRSRTSVSGVEVVELTPTPRTARRDKGKNIGFETPRSTPVSGKTDSALEISERSTTRSKVLKPRNQGK